MASAMGMGIINYPKPRRGDRFCVRKNGANRAAAPSGANGLDANISHGLRRGLPAAATPWLNNQKQVPFGYRPNGSRKETEADLISKSITYGIVLSEPRHPDYRFPKSVRLRSTRDFDAVYQSEHFAADDVLVIRARRNGGDASRLGLSVSRKVGNAVVRNRWKRRIRESFRLSKSSLPPGIDIVVRPRKGAKCEYAAICRSLLKLCQRLDKKMPS